jgi:hypothetical protein
MIFSVSNRVSRWQGEGLGKGRAIHLSIRDFALRSPARQK